MPTVKHATTQAVSGHAYSRATVTCTPLIALSRRHFSPSVFERGNRGEQGSQAVREESCSASQGGS